MLEIVGNKNGNALILQALPWGCVAYRGDMWGITGGSSGIRTLDTFRYAGFQDRCNRPLCQAS